ncbi:MAG TPA: SH3 domain-containing protein [Chloroflexota bacterium]
MAPRLIADRYQLLREVSRAPDATFWQAADTLLDRHVMLELLRPELAEDAAAVERFRDALRETARGGPSPHGRLLDGGTDSDQQLPFAVFEWDDTHWANADAAEARQPVATARATAPPATSPSPGARPPEASPPREARPQRRRSASTRPTRSTRSRNWALPILLTVVPLAVGIIAVSRLLAPSGPSFATVFAVPTGTIQVGNPVVTQPSGATSVPTSRPAAAATPLPSPRPATPTPTGERVQVANTDGIGVALRDGPGGQRLPGKGYDEGVTVTVLERQGEWAHIRGDDGREGWVLAVTVPASR